MGRTGVIRMTLLFAGFASTVWLETVTVLVTEGRASAVGVTMMVTVAVPLNAPAGTVSGRVSSKRSSSNSSSSVCWLLVAKLATFT